MSRSQHIPSNTASANLEPARARHHERAPKPTVSPAALRAISTLTSRKPGGGPGTSNEQHMVAQPGYDKTTNVQRQIQQWKIGQNCPNNPPKSIIWENTPYPELFEKIPPNLPCRMNSRFMKRKFGPRQS
ncbi:hypothetical protein GQ457_06G030540 [Hibiscus cannabinus]